MTSVTDTVMTPTNEFNFDEILDELIVLKTSTSQTVQKVRKLKDQVNKVMKQNAKKLQKGGKKREPSGFAKPTKISKELSKFLGEPDNVEMARTQVTKALTEYIRKHNLQDPKDKRHIMPDNKLKTLLHIQPNEEVTYFNLQKYLKIHFESSTNKLSN